MTNDGVRDGCVNPAPHSVRFPAVPEVMDRRSRINAHGFHGCPPYSRQGIFVRRGAFGVEKHPVLEQAPDFVCLPEVGHQDPSDKDSLWSFSLVWSYSSGIPGTPDRGMPLMN
jgi:hypothetical protein